MKINKRFDEVLWKGFKDPTPIEEDPEASQNAFETNHIDAANDVYNPYNVNAQEIASEAIIAISDELENETNTLGISRSYKHITLPEALLYCYLNDHPDQIISDVTLKTIEATLGKGSVSLSMQIINQEKTLVQYELEYQYAGLRVVIKQNNKIIGKVTYILRGQKCEEIEGALHGKKLVLDPVWHPSKKGELREEHFKYNNRQTTLVYQANKKHSGFNMYGNKQALSMTHHGVKQHKKMRLVSKSVSCYNHHFKTTLWFHTNVLIPVAGNWTIVT
mgnify:FL=1